MSEPYGKTAYTGFIVLMVLAFSPVLIALFLLSIPLWLLGKIAYWGLGEE